MLQEQIPNRAPEQASEFLFEFMKKCDFGAIATVTAEGKPEVAIMQFAVTEDLQLIFDTPASTRKYKNIQKNNHVAFAIWREFDIAQYEGAAIELQGEELAQYKEVLFVKNPDARQWEPIIPDLTFFKVVPHWIRYTGFKQDPWEIAFPKK